MERIFSYELAFLRTREPFHSTNNHLFDWFAGKFSLSLILFNKTGAARRLPALPSRYANRYKFITCLGSIPPLVLLQSTKNKIYLPLSYLNIQTLRHLACHKLPLRIGDATRMPLSIHQASCLCTHRVRLCVVKRLESVLLETNAVDGIQIGCNNIMVRWSTDIEVEHECWTSDEIHLMRKGRRVLFEELLFGGGQVAARMDTNARCPVTLTSLQRPKRRMRLGILFVYLQIFTIYLQFASSNLIYGQTKIVEFNQRMRISNKCTWRWSSTSA